MLVMSIWTVLSLTLSQRTVSGLFCLYSGTDNVHVIFWKLIWTVIRK